MKGRNKIEQRPSTGKTKSFGKPAYYFHADEDFREDWNWNKNEIEGISTSIPQPQIIAIKKPAVS